jgi:hypothetical protein
MGVIIKLCCELLPDIQTDAPVSHGAPGSHHSLTEAAAHGLDSCGRVYVAGGGGGGGGADDAGLVTAESSPYGAAMRHNIYTEPS